MQQIKLRPTLESVEEVASFVENALGEADIPLKLIMKINVAVDEVYSNIVRYSGATSAVVSVDVQQTAIVLSFSDNGKPYDPTQIAEPDITLSAEERKVGGLGMFMVRRLVDSVQYRFENGENHLCLIKNCAP